MRFSLLELLRSRRGLRPAEVMRLLADLPAMADAEPDLVALAGSWLRQIEIELPDDESGEWLKRDITQWPAFALHAGEPCDGDNGPSTMIESAPRAPGDAPSRFAALLYELLGGRRRDGAPFTPLPALNEDANAVLRRAATPRGYADCTSLWAALVQASPPSPDVHIRARRTLKPVGGRSGARVPGTILTLVPQAADTASIRLVARPQFFIGRSRSRADFVTRFLSKHLEDASLATEISRVHAMGELRDGKPHLRDGSGTTASANGSTFCGEALPAESAVPLTGRGVLQLAHFELEVIPVLHAPLANWDSAADLSPAAGAHPGRPKGAILFAPCTGPPVIRQALWIFSGMGFRLDAEGHLAWALDGAEAAAFLHENGCFWLANLECAHGAIRIDDVAIEGRQAAPLTTGSTLQIGNVQYTATLE